MIIHLYLRISGREASNRVARPGPQLIFEPGEYSESLHIRSMHGTGYKVHPVFVMCNIGWILFTFPLRSYWTESLFNDDEQNNSDGSVRGLACLLAITTIKTLLILPAYRPFSAKQQKNSKNTQIKPNSFITHTSRPYVLWELVKMDFFNVKSLWLYTVYNRVYLRISRILIHYLV